MTERSGKPSNLHRDGDRLLQLLIFNEEYLVSACHQRALITSLPFVHTARRSYRLNDPVRPPDCGNAAGSPAAMPREAVQTLSFRGRRSRNKVSVGEPAEGSLSFLHRTLCTVWSYVSTSDMSTFVCASVSVGRTLLRQTRARRPPSHGDGAVPRVVAVCVLAACLISRDL